MRGAPPAGRRIHYIDVPPTAPDDEFSLQTAIEQFHLQGQHDQKSHGNRAGRRIAPVASSAKTVNKIATDLTMDALPENVQKKVEAAFEKGLLVSPEESQAFLLDMAEEALADGLDGVDWYQDAHDTALDMADRHGIDPEVAVAIVAALSPGTSWEENVENADSMMAAASMIDAVVDGEAVRNTNVWANRPNSRGVRNSPNRVAQDDTFRSLYERDPDLAAVYLAKHMGASVGYSYDKFRKATDLMMSNDPDTIDTTLGGAKVRSFYNNIARPTDGTDVTIDIHMQRALTLDLDSTTAQEKYDRALWVGDDKNTALTATPAHKGSQLGAMPLMADVVRDATAEFNRLHGLDLLPHQFQAVVWVRQIDEYPTPRINAIKDGKELEDETS